MSVTRQLLKEVVMPLVAAMTWTAYNLYDIPISQLSVRKFVNVFGPSFFFASWLVAQWFRVKKQQGVEKGLETIERSIQDTLSKLEATATHLAGHITGGDSVCYFFGPQPSGDAWTNMLVIHSGAHPLYDVTARICDLDKFDLQKNQPHALPSCLFEEMVTLGNLIPEHARFSPISLALGDGSYKRFNIFFAARNGSFSQLLRCKRVKGRWVFATRVERNGQVVFEKVDDAYLQDATSVPWDA